MQENIQLNIPVPEPVRWILGRLRDGGFEAYIVGGCVRDALLQVEPKDWDITTSALPEQVKSLFSNTVDTGIQHGTVMVLRHGVGYEVTTFRIDGEYKDGRHPENVTFTRSLEEDLKRRDFTINAFAYDPETGIVDLFDGVSDLKNRLIRCVGDPDERFGEDALRIMRAVRFSAQLSFEIEEGTLAAIQRHAENLAMVSMERIRVEFEKTLFSNHPEKINLYQELGMAPYVIPVSEVQEKCFVPEYSVLYDQVQEEEKLRILRLAFFFQKLTPEETRFVMRRMKYDNKTIRLVSGIINSKDRTLSEERTEIRKLLHENGVELAAYLLEYRRIFCSVFAEGGEKEEELLKLERIRKTMDEILKDGDAFTLAQLKIDGSDLIQAGIPKGKEIGEVLNALLDAVIEDTTLNRKDQLLLLAEKVRK